MWLPDGEDGLRRVNNSKGVKVTTTGQDGLKIPANSACCECLGRALLKDLLPDLTAD